MEKVRVGVIGLGEIGQGHLENIRDIPRHSSRLFQMLT